MIRAYEMEHYLITAAEIQAVEKERKAKNILLMAIPKEHMRRFHGMDDAKEIWEVIRTRRVRKGIDRYQHLIPQLKLIGAEVSTEDANHKVFEQEIKASKNIFKSKMFALVQQSKSNTNKVKSGFTSTYSTCTPSTSSTNIPEKEVPVGFADEIAMIAIRMKKFYKKTGRRVCVDGKTPGTHDGKKKRDSFYQHQEAGKQEKNQMGLLTMDDGIVNWGEHTAVEETNHALMAINSSNEVTLCSKTCIDSYNTLKLLYDEQMNLLGNQEAQILAYSQAVKKLEAQLVTYIPG
ncbi:hypothetical protein Tco_0001168 [Tanacetum coccineum]